MIQNLLLFNRALQGKWLWCCHYQHERKTLRKVVVDLKFDCAWTSGFRMKLMGSMGWSCGNLIEVVGRFSNPSRLVVGDSYKVKLLHDLWCEDSLQGRMV